MSDLILFGVGGVLLFIIITVIVIIAVSIKKRKEEADFQLPDLEEDSKDIGKLKTMTSNIPTTIDSVDEDSVLDIIKSSAIESDSFPMEDDKKETVKEPQNSDFKLPEFDVEKEYEYEEKNIIEEKTKPKHKKKNKKSKTGDNFLDVFNEMEEELAEEDK